MKPMFSPSYLDSLFESALYEKRIELSGLIYGSTSYHSNETNYGLPIPAFIFIESLLWFAQAIRSGTWTYFEVTPFERQEAMKSGLEKLAPSGFATNYELGMRDWRDQTEIAQVDRWIESHEEENTRWLGCLAKENRLLIQSLFA